MVFSCSVTCHWNLVYLHKELLNIIEIIFITFCFLLNIFASIPPIKPKYLTFKTKKKLKIQHSLWVFRRCSYWQKAVCQIAESECYTAATAAA